jgi:threonine dehydratase
LNNFVSLKKGQGTMALEIIQEIPDVDAIIVPTGGGGLLAGIAVAAKAMNPDIKIIVFKIYLIIFF